MKSLRSCLPPLALALAGMLFFGAVATATTVNDEARQSIEEIASQHAAIAEAITPSVVRVEYTLRYDGSDTPVSRGWNQRCPNCGTYHSDRLEPIIKEDRPLERAGFAISPTKVVTAHLLVHPRFVEKIEVSHNGRKTTARVAAYAAEQRAAILQLEEPLHDVQPLEFGAGDDEPLFSVAVQESGGRWTTSVHPFSARLLVREDGTRRIHAQPESVIVNAAGEVAAIVMTEDLPADGSWITAPAGWEHIAAGTMEELLANHASRVKERLPRVSLHFRSPREEPGDMGRRHMYSGMSDDESATEMEAIAMTIGEGKFLVLAHLSPSATARLERIRIHLPEEESAVEATFEASLADFGAFIARLEETAPNGFRLTDDPIEAQLGSLLLATDLEVRGEQLRVHHQTARIADLKKGRRGAIFPDLAGGSGNVFLFDLEGALVAFPIEIRERTIGERSRWRSHERVLAPVALLAEILDDPDSHFDPANVPVDPDQEGRLAWLGVDLQPLDAGLARDYRVATETNNGETGALVSFVYPGSPAAEAGIAEGDILLRISADGLPRPFPVRLDGDRRYSEPFPWEHLDQIPEEYYSFLPPPWTSFANPFNRFLTELGFGRQVVIDSVRDGETSRHEVQIVEGPPHYEAAAQHKSDEFGLTVRELTFETRRFFLKEEDSPGLIVARIESGSAASSGGLKPFELITHVNGEPVLTIQQFEEAAEAENELQLNVQRMHQGRIVVLRRAGGQ